MELDTSDVIVVGGGIIGSCIAYYLAREGRDVVVLDPAPGEGASYGNAGMLCPSYSLPMANPDSLLAGLSILTGRGPVTFRRPVPARTLLWMARFALACRPGRAWREAASLHDLTTRSVELYDEMIADGLDLELRPHGWTYVFHNEGEYHAHIRFAERLVDAGVRHELLDRDALAAREPNVARDVAGAVVYPDDRNMDPGRTTRVVAEAAEKYGARFVKERLVGAERHGGRITKVWSDHRELRAGAFVLATGAASHSVGRCFGVSLPVEAGHGLSLTLSAPNQQLLTGALMAGDAHVVISPGANYVRITSGMEFGAHGAPGPLPAAISRMRHLAEVTVPGLRDLPRDGESWRGARPMTPTGVPIVRPVAENLIAAVGHNTQGMTLGPIAGRTVAEQVDSVLGPRRTNPITY
ncbi:FAD-binding oxidoreductase [Saccharopolyspora sp. ASAGF58]|uniref:NAD(P)/FAD-dependent oxidoreductase n=1 Tax=Saccharopolyspora sp. ASAGF58 TaxID=2719023 RepID=UPI00144005CD|nr:FAD-dependent oxidoreductase [Saccharopolyspora sp. ASAGF58]QIZ36523.1 FAD-dependent oxidoreductase [Saccharopolyspora sp. ASAGF58]